MMHLVKEMHLAYWVVFFFPLYCNVSWSVLIISILLLFAEHSVFGEESNHY